jgi:hypothetical protein
LTWTLACALAVALLTVGPTATLADITADASTELATGIVTFFGGSQVVTDNETIEIAKDAVRITTTLRSADSQSRSIMMGFGLPDIDMAALGGARVSGVNFEPNNPTNYIGFWLRADDATVPLKVEQRALALGLVDITPQLQRLGVQLYPVDDRCAGYFDGVATGGPNGAG